MQEITDVVENIRQVIDELQNGGFDLPSEFIEIFEEIESQAPHYRLNHTPPGCPALSEPNLSAMQELWNQAMIDRLVPDQKCENTLLNICYRCLRLESIVLAELIEKEFRPTATVIISISAGEKLQGLTEVYQATPQTFVEALLHYALSVKKRPTSWEATKPFDFSHYDPRNNDAAADRWF